MDKLIRLQKILLAISLMFLLSCINDSVKNAGKSIETTNGIAKVVDLNGNPVVGAKVQYVNETQWVNNATGSSTIVEQELTTNSNGEFYIQSTGEDNYSVLIKTAQGGVFTNNVKNLSDGDQFIVEPTHPFTGYAPELAGTNALIRIVGTDISATVDNDGYFYITELPIGVYRFVVVSKSNTTLLIMGKIVQSHDFEGKGVFQSVIDTVGLTANLNELFESFELYFNEVEIPVDFKDDGVSEPFTVKFIADGDLWEQKKLNNKSVVLVEFQSVPGENKLILTALPAVESKIQIESEHYMNLEEFTSQENFLEQSPKRRYQVLPKIVDKLKLSSTSSLDGVVVIKGSDLILEESNGFYEIPQLFSGEFSINLIKSSEIANLGTLTLNIDEFAPHTFESNSPFHLHLIETK